MDRSPDRFDRRHLLTRVLPSAAVLAGLPGLLYLRRHLGARLHGWPFGGWRAPKLPKGIVATSPDSRSGYQQLDVGGRFEGLIPLDSMAVAISLGLARGGVWRVIWRAL